MFKPSSGSDKSSVIHSTVKETLEHTYGEIVNSVDERIFTQFHSLLIKTPVVFVRDQIPSDVLQWYKTNVFSQDKPKLSQESAGLSKEQNASVEHLNPVSKSKTLIKPRIEPPKETIKSTTEPPSKGNVNTTKPIENETQKLPQKAPPKVAQSTTQNVTQNTRLVSVPKDDEIVGMDVEEAKRVESRKLETNQLVIQLPKESSIKSINMENIQPKNDDIGPIVDRSDSNQPVNGTKIDSNISESTRENESTTMEIDEPERPTGESFNPQLNEAINRIYDSIQPPIESSGPKIEANLQLSEESSNESLALDPNMEGLNSEAMEELITAVLKNISEENVSSMGLEDSQQLTDVLSQLEAAQSMDQQLDQSVDQPMDQVNEEVKPPPLPQGDPNQSSLQLSEESSNDSMNMDKADATIESKMDDDADKRDTVNDDKMQNIKFNSNVLAAIEDENNLLDFEDI